METYLPLIQTTLNDWLLLTLGNPWYAGGIALVVFLLTAILYGFKVSSLKQLNKATENARIDTENRLNAELDSARQLVQDTQLQVQKAQDELAEITVQVQTNQQLAQTEADRANKLDTLLAGRNKQIADIIQTLHTSFDLGERPLPLMGDNKAEGLWQQHDRVIALLSGRLRAEQTAKAEIQAAHQADLKKHAEQTAVLASLQAAQAQHAEQVVQLELALDAQTALLQQQESQAQQVLAQTLDKHQSELARLAELEEQASEAVNARLLLSELNAALTAKNALIAQLENDKNQWLKSAKTVVEAVVAPANGFASDLSHIAEPVATVVDDLEATVKEHGAGLAGKFKGLFGKSKPEPQPEAEPTVAEPLPEPVPVPEIVQPEPVVELAETEALAVVKEPAAGVAGKLKGLFGKAKAEPAVAEPVAVAETQAPVEETPPASPEKSTFGKFKGMLASKPAVEETAPVIAEPAVEPEPAPPANPSTSVFGKLKNLLATHPEAEASPAAAPEPPVEEPAPISPAPRPTGKLKNFFGNKAEVVAEPPVVAEEEPPLAEATTKSTLGKLKGLLGKAK